MFSSCHRNTNNIGKKYSLDYYSDLRDEKYSLNVGQIHQYICDLCSKDVVSFAMDKQTKKYYTNNNSFIWINRRGISERADTLLKYLKNVKSVGLSTKAFRLKQIEKDIDCLRQLDVINKENNINFIMARLEYNLTRAYFRYSAGMYYGFINPDFFYNNLETYNIDSITTKYRQLCEFNVKRPDQTFYSEVISKAVNNNLSGLLDKIEPDGLLYKLLINRLNTRNITNKERLKIICNIERCRWKSKYFSDFDSYDKYVIVNIPSYCLRAVEKNEVLTMRIGCGTIEHKTPLLTSWITRMDINPQWIVPKSIAKGFFNDYSYMHKMGMFIYDRKEGKLPPESVSYNKIMSGEQYIIQSGGPKNSLGRIIFRFDNNFSVFLHDTSSPWLLQRNRRAISHGCVRVEKPFELALFLLSEKDDEVTSKLKYSMTTRLVNDNDSSVVRKINRKLIINTLKVKPAIPLFITYYTVYYDKTGNIVEYDDIYGYDAFLIEKLAPIVE